MRRLILHIPHSSDEITLTEGFIVKDDVIEAEILKLTDWHTDDLFYSEEDVMIKAEFSRVFCDVERFTDDNMEEMAKYGMGVLYERADSGEVIRNVMTDFRKRVLEEFYHPHHLKLKRAVEDELSANGRALIVDCHSFPDKPFIRDLNKEPNRPDFCLGTDAFHTPGFLKDTAEDFLKDLGFSVKVNKPYEGTLVPIDFLRRNENVFSIMVEVNRKLYLKDGTNKRNKDYERVKKVVQELLGYLKFKI